MEPIVWKDEYLVGVAEIDRQHQDFLKLINRLLILHNSGDAIAMEKRFLMEVQKYAQYHFASEENIMRVIQYPHIEKQEREHDILLEELTQRMADYMKVNQRIGGIISYLVDWFITHTIQEDKQIGVYANTILTKKKIYRDACGS